MFIKRAGLFWCWGRGDGWKAERSYQGLIKNQLIFINLIYHCYPLCSWFTVQPRHFQAIQRTMNSNKALFTLPLILLYLKLSLSILIAPSGKGRTPRRRCTVTSCSITAQEEVSSPWYLDPMLATGWILFHVLAPNVDLSVNDTWLFQHILNPLHHTFHLHLNIFQT